MQHRKLIVESNINVRLRMNHEEIRTVYLKHNITRDANLSKLFEKTGGKDKGPSTVECK